MRGSSNSARTGPFAGSSFLKKNTNGQAKKKLEDDEDYDFKADTGVN